MSHFSDRSRATSAVAAPSWCLRGPRAARGLSGAYQTSKPERCGDARETCRGCRLHSDIFGRISSEGQILVLFAFQDLRRATFFQDLIYKGIPYVNEICEIEMTSQNPE